MPIADFTVRFTSHTRMPKTVAERVSWVPSGGDIFLHGLPNGFGWLGNTHRLKDWTDGCIAVTNDEMDEIWRAVPDGTLIEIRP